MPNNREPGPLLDLADSVRGIAYNLDTDPVLDAKKAKAAAIKDTIARVAEYADDAARECAQFDVPAAVASLPLIVRVSEELQSLSRWSRDAEPRDVITEIAPALARVRDTYAEKLQAAAAEIQAAELRSSVAQSPPPAAELLTTTEFARVAGISDTAASRYTEPRTLENARKERKARDGRSRRDPAPEGRKPEHEQAAARIREENRRRPPQ